MADEESEPQYQVLYIDQPNEEVTGWIKRAGRARVSYVDGSTYEGDFNAAQQKHGQGTYTWSYSAIKETEGVPEWEEPEEGAPQTGPPKPFMRYTGGYQYGLKHGLGLLEYPNGDTYRGQFGFDKRHGAGTYKYVADGSGNMYSGEWRNGRRHGQGAFVFGSDGSQLVGTWVDGNIVTGKWLLRDGTVFAGDFAKNKPRGPGSFVFPNGAMITGAYGPQRSAGGGDGDDAQEDDEEDEDGAIAAQTWATSELASAHTCSAAELTRAPLPGRPFAPTYARRIKTASEENRASPINPFPIRFVGGPRAETGNNGLGIDEVNTEVGYVVISNLDRRPAKLESAEGEGEDGGDSGGGDAGDGAGDLEEEDEEALAKRLTAHLKGFRLKHDDAQGKWDIPLPDIQLPRGAKLRILFGECAANPRLADPPPAAPKLDEDGNPVEEEEPDEESKPKVIDWCGGRENIFASGFGELSLECEDVTSRSITLWTVGGDSQYTSGENYIPPPEKPARVEGEPEPERELEEEGEDEDD